LAIVGRVLEINAIAMLGMVLLNAVAAGHSKEAPRPASLKHAR
jgi:hypothetical protein